MKFKITAEVWIIIIIIIIIIIMGLQVIDKNHEQIPERVINVNVMYDVPVNTYRTILANRSDTVLHYIYIYKKKEKRRLAYWSI
jgi:hypothetical protein